MVRLSPLVSGFVGDSVFGAPNSVMNCTWPEFSGEQERDDELELDRDLEKNRRFFLNDHETSTGYLIVF